MSLKKDMELKRNQARDSAEMILSVAGSKKEAISKAKLLESFNPAHWARVRRYISVSSKFSNEKKVHHMSCDLAAQFAHGETLAEVYKEFEEVLDCCVAFDEQFEAQRVEVLLAELKPLLDGVKVVHHDQSGFVCVTVEVSK